MLLPLTSIAELFRQREVEITIFYCAVFSNVVSAVHPETIPTSTVAMLLVLCLYIYNKRYILKTDYLPIQLLKNYGCFRKQIVEVTHSLYSIVAMQNLDICFFLCRSNVKPSWSCLLCVQTTPVSLLVKLNGLTKQIIYIC